MAKQVYTSESRVHNLGDVLREMCFGLLNARYVAYRFALKDIKRQYARSTLGFLWDFIDPLVLGLLFYFLRHSDVFSSGDLKMPYAVFLIYGLMLYQTFVQATVLPLNVILDSGSLLSQQKVSPEALILSVFYRVIFMSSFRVAVILVFAFASGAFVMQGVFFFLLCFPALVLSGMAIGVFLAPFNAIYGDVGRFANVILVPLRFISPVFFVLPETKTFQLINTLNPFAQLLENLRSLGVYGTLSSPAPLLAHLALLFIVGCIGWFVFHVSIRILAERV